MTSQEVAEDISQNISNKAQEILDSFLEKMKNIEIEPTYNVTRKTCLREELDEPSKSDSEFIQNFLNNAPNSNQEAIITKKGDWTK